MAIKDLEARQGKVDIIVEVVDKQEPREFDKFGKKGRVCNAKVKDDTGEVTLTLWNDDIDKVKVGDKVEIKNGYVSEWQGEKQLSTGKFGTMDVVGGQKPLVEKAKAPAKLKDPDDSEDIEDSVAEEDIDVDEEDIE